VGKLTPMDDLKLLRMWVFSPLTESDILAGFMVPTSLIYMSSHAVQLWQMIIEHTTESEKVLFLCPRNGA
jgi:hypothetical protein